MANRSFRNFHLSTDGPTLISSLHPFVRSLNSLFIVQFLSIEHGDNAIITRGQDNTYDYDVACTFFISLIINGVVMITPFCGDACGWLKISILRDGEH